MSARTRRSLRVFAFANVVALASLPPAASALEQISTGPQVGTTTAASSSGLGFTPNGENAFFQTTQQLTATDTDAGIDVYLRNGTTTTLMTPGNFGYAFQTFGDVHAEVGNPQGVTSNGRLVFQTNQTVGSDADGLTDVFVSDAGQIYLVSKNTPTHNATTSGWSGDGETVLFSTNETVAGTVDADAMPRSDLFKTVNDGAPEMVSAANPPIQNNTLGDLNGTMQVNQDGSHVLFNHTGTLSSDDSQNSASDYYDRGPGLTTLVTRGSPTVGTPLEFDARASSDFSTFIYESPWNIGPDSDGETDVFTYSGGATTLATPSTPNSVFLIGPHTADALTFLIRTNLGAGAGDSIYRVTNGSLSLIAPIDFSFFRWYPSTDLAEVAFETSTALVAEDTDTTADTYIGTGGGEYTLISDDDDAGTDPNVAASFGDISADGEKVVFQTTEAFSEEDEDAAADLYVYEDGALDLVTSEGPIAELAFPAGVAGAKGNTMSDDGDQVFFTTAGKLVPDDEDGVNDVYRADLGPETCPLPPSLDGSAGTDGEVNCPLFVTETTDEPDLNPGDGHCDINAGTDEDQCTLRAAIQEANDRAGADTIMFAIAGGGRPTIKPETALPALNQTVTIDGFSQPGSTAGEPGVELDGSAAPANTIGLRVSASNSVVKGLMVNRFTNSGIQVGAGNGSAVAGCWLGFDTGGSGFVPAGNGAGVEVKAPGTLIGGPAAADRNVIAGSGNVAALRALEAQLNSSSRPSESQVAQLLGAVGVGVLVSDAAAGGTRIENNVVGLAPNGMRTGSVADPVGQYGNTIGIAVIPQGGSLSGLTIGGATAATGNVITGNVMGVLTGGGDDLKLLNNSVGQGIDGNPVGPAPFGNFMGIVMAGRSAGAQVGVKGQPNKIQGNMIGLMLGGQGLGATVQGNEIGVDQRLLDFGADIKAALSNQQPPNMGKHNILGVMMLATRNVLLGGQDQGNSILGNVHGVFLGGPGSTGNRVAGNLIGTTQSAPKPISQLKASDMGGAVGVLLAAGSGNRIGEPGAGNLIAGNMLGLISAATSGNRIEANVFGTNVLGLTTFNTTDTVFAANQITGSGVGVLGVQFEPTERELQGTDLDENEVRREDRDTALDAPAMQEPLALANGFADTDVSEQAVAFDEPPAAAGASAGRSRIAAAPNARSTNNVFQGNAIGTDAGGSVRAGNAFGMWFLGGMRNVAIGGAGAGQGNVIAHNRVTGLMLGPGVAQAWPSEVVLRGNRIFDNHAPGMPLRGLGFDLLEVGSQTRTIEDIFGPSPPDVGDADDGPNTVQNAPEIAAAVPDGQRTRVVGTFNSAPGTQYEVEFFGNSRCSPFGYGEGELPLGVTRMRTNAAGNAAFDGRIRVPDGFKRAVTAIATGPSGSSEFSNCQRVADTDVGVAPGSLTPDAQGNVTITVFCLGEANCPGEATLNQGGGGASAAAKRKKKKRVKGIGSKRFRVRKGRQKRVKIRLKRSALKKLNKRKQLRIKASVRLKGGKGKRRKDTVTWTLHARAKKKRR